MKVTKKQIVKAIRWHENHDFLSKKLKRIKVSDAGFELSYLVDVFGLEIFDVLCLLDKKELCQRFAIWCARNFQDLMDDERSIAALDSAEAFLRGNNSRKEHDINRSKAYNAWQSKKERFESDSEFLIKSASQAAFANTKCIYESRNAGSRARSIINSNKLEISQISAASIAYEATTYSNCGVHYSIISTQAANLGLTLLEQITKLKTMIDAES